jgi:hypothetical protein
MAKFETEVEVEVLTDRNATVAQVSLPWDADGTEIVATGSSKREKGDPYVEELGVSLALERAFRNLARELEQQNKAASKALYPESDGVRENDEVRVWENDEVRVFNSVPELLDALALKGLQAVDKKATRDEHGRFAPRTSDGSGR